MAEKLPIHARSRKHMMKTTTYDKRLSTKSRGGLFGLVRDNLLANINIGNAVNGYKLQDDLLWQEESPLLADACHACIWTHQSINSKLPIRVLDVGCRTGELITRFVGQNGLLEQMTHCTGKLLEIDAVELDRPVYDVCKQRFNSLKGVTKTRLTVHQANATQLPFPPNTFDLVLNRHMLHYVSVTYIPNILNEIHRVLKPGGIVHFIAEDVEMVYSSVDDDDKLQEQQQLWSNGVCGAGTKLGVDLRIGRKLPALLTQCGFEVQCIKYALVDTYRNDRQLLAAMCELWRRVYNDTWKTNDCDHKYDKYFRNFIQTVKDEKQYVCWNVPMVQATKKTTAG